MDNNRKLKDEIAKATKSYHSFNERVSKGFDSDHKSRIKKMHDKKNYNRKITVTMIFAIIGAVTTIAMLVFMIITYMSS